MSELTGPPDEGTGSRKHPECGWVLTGAFAFCASTLTVWSFVFAYSDITTHHLSPLRILGELVLCILLASVAIAGIAVFTVLNGMRPASPTSN